MRVMIKLILALFLLGALFCDSEKNSMEPSSESSQLSIVTNKNVYTWKAGESDFFIVIEGSMENKTDTTFYSRLGDGFGTAEQNQIFFAGNSAGFLEKYHRRTRTWIEKELLGILIEGSKIIPIKPATMYVFHADLQTGENAENGTYRLRVDFYDRENFEEGENPFHAYSNSFEIE